MGGLMPYIEGQPIEPYGRPRVYMTIEDQKELEAYREFGNLTQMRALCDKYHLLLDEYHELIKREQEIKNKAIDDFAEKLIMHFADWKMSELHCVIVDTIDQAMEGVNEIAEQMKGV